LLAQLLAKKFFIEFLKRLLLLLIKYSNAIASCTAAFPNDPRGVSP
jgi:hypothetical protein